MKKLTINHVTFILLLGLASCHPMLAKRGNTRIGTTVSRSSMESTLQQTQELKTRSSRLLQSLASINLGDLLAENVGAKVVATAKSVASVTATSKFSECLPLMSKDDKNEFRQLLDHYKLLDGGALTYIVQPTKLLIQLQGLISELSNFQQITKELIKEFEDVKSAWAALSERFGEKAQQGFLATAEQAMDIMCRACASQTTQEIKTKTHTTPDQLKLLEVRTAQSPADIFSHHVIAELGIKDPESADKILKPLYDGISNIEFVRLSLKRWPADFELSKEFLDSLNLAVTAYEINSRIQGVVAKMRNWTLIRAKRALQEISFHLSQFQGTLNEVTDNVGPFKKDSDALVHLCEKVIHDNEELKGSMTQLIQELSKETKKPATTNSATPPATIPAAAAPLPTPVAIPTPAPVPTPIHEPAPAPTPEPAPVHVAEPSPVAPPAPAAPVPSV